MRTEEAFLFMFSAVVNVCTLFSLHFSLACWWEYQACSVGCIRHTSSTESMITNYYVLLFLFVQSFHINSCCPGFWTVLFDIVCFKCLISNTTEYIILFFIFKGIYSMSVSADKTCALSLCSKQNDWDLIVKVSPAARRIDTVGLFLASVLGCNYSDAV